MLVGRTDLKIECLVVGFFLGDVARTIEVETFQARLHIKLGARVLNVVGSRGVLVCGRIVSHLKPKPEALCEGGRPKLSLFHQNLFLAKLKTLWQS